MNLTSLKPDYLEKIMGFQWALMLLASIFFIDYYLILKHGINIYSLDMQWIKENSSIHESLYLISSFSIAFGLIIPGISFVIFQMFISLLEGIYLKMSGKEIELESWWKSAALRINNKDFVEPEALKDWAIKKSNFAAYREYELFIASRKQADFIEYLCRTVLVFALANLFITTDTQPILLIIRDNLKELVWYLRYPSLMLLMSVLAYLYITGCGLNLQRKLIKIRNHGISDDSK